MFPEFLQTCRYLRNLSPKTLDIYKRSWECYQRFTSEPVSKKSLQEWVMWMLKRGLKPGACNVYIRSMNSFLSWLNEEKHLSDKLRLKLLNNPPKPLRGFSDLEIRSLLSFRPRGFTELRTWTLIQFILDTGCRIEETLGISNEEQIDLNNLLVTVLGKGNKTRRVPISLECRKTLWRYSQVKIRRKIHLGFVFSTYSGNKLSYRNVYRDIKALCAKAGVVGEHVHPHAFRHAFATTYIRRGGDIYRLSRILGHTSISTTQLYLRSMGIEQIAENHSSLSPLSHQR